jgi:hypothetical protein
MLTTLKRLREKMSNQQKEAVTKNAQRIITQLERLAQIR